MKIDLNSGQILSLKYRLLGSFVNSCTQLNQDALLIVHNKSTSNLKTTHIFLQVLNELKTILPSLNPFYYLGRTKWFILDPYKFLLYLIISSIYPFCLISVLIKELENSHYCLHVRFFFPTHTFWEQYLNAYNFFFMCYSLLYKFQNFKFLAKKLQMHTTKEIWST